MQIEHEAQIEGTRETPASIPQITQLLESGKREQARHARGAAILIPLLPNENGLHVLFEVRAAHLTRQPGEVCLPGGHIESGEPPREAAIREACEELLIEPSQVQIVSDLGEMIGPGGLPLWVFVGSLDDYRGTFDPEEVDSTFTVPLAYFLETEPTIYRTQLKAVIPDDLPWDVIPKGRDYPWRPHRHEIPFYLETSPIIWGFTARVMHLLAKLLKAGMQS